MRATTLNHISIHAEDLDESPAFYTHVFGMQRIPSPSFRHPVAWLRLGDQELHLFQRDTPAPPLHHFALNVDDFEAVYIRAASEPQAAGLALQQPGADLALQRGHLT